MSDDKVQYRDVEFELATLTPGQAHLKFPDRVPVGGHPGISVYVVATCDTVRGPFVCIMPLDGRAAVLERDLAKKLVSEAYDELAKKWVEEGFDKA